MAHIDNSARSPVFAQPPGAAVAPATHAPRVRRSIRPTLGTLRLEPQLQTPVQSGAAAVQPAPLSPTAVSQSRRSAALGPPPKFGEALAQASSQQAKKTQAHHQADFLNPWRPVFWPRRRQPASPSQQALDLEAQALGETASLPVTRVCASPGTVGCKTPFDALQKASIGSKVCLHLVDAAILGALSTAELTAFVDALAASKHMCHWHYSRLDGLSHLNPLPWLRSGVLSGTSVLFLHLLARRDVAAAETIMCVRPVEIALELGERLPELFTLPLLGRVFASFVPAVTRPCTDPNLDENDQLSALALLVAAFMSTRVHADAGALEQWTVRLLKRFEASGFESTSANVGLMAGTILAGNRRYGASIVARDQMIKKYVWFVVALSFAGLSFIDNPNISGGLTIGAFLLGALFDNYWPICDLSLEINRLEGKLRTKMLKVDMFRNQYDNTEMMAWIDNVKKCNGY